MEDLSQEGTLPGNFTRGDKKKSLSFRKRIKKHYTNWAAQQGLIDPCKGQHGPCHTHSQAPTKPSSVVLSRKEIKERLEEVEEVDEIVNDEGIITNDMRLGNKNEKEIIVEAVRKSCVEEELDTTEEPYMKYVRKDDIELHIPTPVSVEATGTNVRNNEQYREKVLAIENEIEVPDSEKNIVEEEIVEEIKEPKLTSKELENVIEPEMIHNVVVEQIPLAEIPILNNTTQVEPFTEPRTVKGDVLQSNSQVKMSDVNNEGSSNTDVFETEVIKKTEIPVVYKVVTSKSDTFEVIVELQDDKMLEEQIQRTEVPVCEKIIMEEETVDKSEDPKLVAKELEPVVEPEFIQKTVALKKETKIVISEKVYKTISESGSEENKLDENVHEEVINDSTNSEITLREETITDLIKVEADLQSAAEKETSFYDQEACLDKNINDTDKFTVPINVIIMDNSTRQLEQEENIVTAVTMTENVHDMERAVDMVLDNARDENVYDIVDKSDDSLALSVTEITKSFQLLNGDAMTIEPVNEGIISDASREDSRGSVDALFVDIINAEEAFLAKDISENILDSVIDIVVSNKNIDSYEPIDDMELQESYGNSWEEEDTWDDYISEDLEYFSGTDKSYADFEIGVWSSALWTSDMKVEKCVDVKEEVVGWGMPVDRTSEGDETVGSVGSECWDTWVVTVSDTKKDIGRRRTKKDSLDNDSDVCESPTNEDSVSTDEGIVATDDEDIAVVNLKKVLVVNPGSDEAGINIDNA